jgi:hypothetical protein
MSIGYIGTFYLISSLESRFYFCMNVELMFSEAQ